MKIKTYNLNTAARERLADWVYNNHKPRIGNRWNPEYTPTPESMRERANHAAGACGGDCWMCTAQLSDYSTWALDTANSHADNFEGCAHVELAPWETYSGHAEVISFIESDFDITEEDGEEDGDE